MTREEAIEIINRENDPNNKEVWEVFPEYRKALDMAIKALEQEPKTGHWRHYEGMLICSECGTEFYDDIMEYCGDDVPKCCPNCGHHMVEPHKSEVQE